MDIVIQTKNLEKNYGANEVLKGVTLRITKGEIYVLLGKNGAGKSTLFKLLTGLSSPSGGEISILSEANNLEIIKRKIGSSINEAVFYEHLTAKANLEIHCDYMDYPYDATHIDDVLALVGLTSQNPNPVRQYSLGMRQRLTLARCLVHDPEILIVDELLNGLDPKGIRQFRGLLEKIAQSGKTILMSSHILTEVEAVATTIGIIYDGELILEDTKEQLVQTYQEGLEDFLIGKMEGEL